MSPQFKAQARAEEADLLRKLEAVRAVLRAYGEAPLSEAPAPEKAPGRPALASPPATSANKEKKPLEGFSPYGADVVRAAIKVVKERPGGPVATRDMVAAIEAMGQEIRGVDKVNALSALLARSADLTNHGRRGWTLSPALEAIAEADRALEFVASAALVPPPTPTPSAIVDRWRLLAERAVNEVAEVDK